MSNFYSISESINEKPFRVYLDDELYPKRIKTIMNGKAPKHLDMLGNIDILNMAGLGFCGSRKSSDKGMKTAQDCAIQAAYNNVSVVSGNAAGIDFEAHYNCLKAGGSTILVLPEGINHFRVRKALQPVWDWNRVLVISQFQENDTWKAFRAMTRNQLIIALSRVMIVIEAGEKGGTLNAGKETLKSGIPLYVAQYQDMSVDARGNQILLNMGALKLAKSRSTNKASLAKVFESMKEDIILKNMNKQKSLLEFAN